MMDDRRIQSNDGEPASVCKSSSSVSTALLPPYIPTLDGWRAIAILLVLGCHARDRIWGPAGLVPQPLINGLMVHGVLGVDVFFGISGFLITRKLLDEYQHKGEVDLLAFYWRRFFRIFPAAWTYLALISVFALTGFIVVAPGELMSCLLFWRNYNESFGWYTGQFWSLIIEEHYYLLWPAIFAALSPRRACMAALLSAFTVGVWRNWSAAQGLIISALPNSIPEHRTDTRLDSLLWACVVAISFPLISRTLLKIRLGYLSPFVFGVLLVLAGILKAGGAVTMGQSILRPILIPLMIVSTVVFPQGWIGRFLETAPLRFVGKISYSLYLWQQPFFILDSATAGTLKAWQYWPFAPLAVFACAAASYHFIERPLIRLGAIFQQKLRAKTPIYKAAELPVASLE
jgi:peptidoglycan/LPS O-acetylase OafA/YrhL